LIITAIGALILTILFLVTYGYLISQQTYKKEVVIDGQPVEKNIIGGFRLTENAKRQIADRGISIQDYFMGTEYTEDEVWMRGWRALAKQVFVLVYICLVASGSIALAAMALLVGLKF
jgi:hypothetical protein